MELLSSFSGIPYLFHGAIVSVVCLGAVLLFVFGFKSTEEPSFNKTKGDSKLASKKKKSKEKKFSNGLANSLESKSKLSITPKPKLKATDDKGKKINTLKDSKNIINTKSAKKEQVVKTEKVKKKGKENVDSRKDYNDEEGGWERAGSKKKRKLQNGSSKEKGNDKKWNKWSGDVKSSKNDTKIVTDTNSIIREKQKHENYGSKRNSTEPGGWQEAKSSKKRRKVQKEA